MPKKKIAEDKWSLELPWSNGCLSAKLWRKGRGVVIAVPELDILCFGTSQSEAVLRLFSNLLRYYNELKGHSRSLNERQQSHLELLRVWVKTVEDKMTYTPAEPISIGSRRQ